MICNSWINYFLINQLQILIDRAFNIVEKNEEQQRKRFNKNSFQKTRELIWKNLTASFVDGNS